LNGRLLKSSIPKTFAQRAPWSTDETHAAIRIRDRRCMARNTDGEHSSDGSQIPGALDEMDASGSH
jgi:hypothetical protein